MPGTHPRLRAAILRGGGILIFLLLAAPAHAARINELAESTLSGRMVRFFTFQDPSLRYALLGSMLLGICCGLMGAFLVVRKLSLLGDALSHAVLPGVALGFLWGMTKDPLAIFIGATVAGLLGAGTVQLLRHTTRHKEDASIGFVLASFFGVGVCLMTMIQNVPGGNKSGLDKFMFGQAAALGRGDVLLLAVVALLALGAVTVFYKEYTITSFDPGFARSMGLPVQVFHYSLMLLLAFAIVSALQAVGVVLVTAMLVIPAATAFLLTDRLGWLLVLSAVFGMCAGAIGAFFSFVGRNLPTGPFMVLAAAAVFTAAILFGPRHGIVARWWRHVSRSARIRRENTLKSVYHVLEDEGFRSEQVDARELAERRRETIEEAQAQLNTLRRHGLATLSGDGISASLTPEGWQRACEIVRNHRLWELYLTNAAQIAADHVHEDAEKIEHVLGEETVRRLEKRLNNARRDPHGRLIPGLEDIRLGAGARPTPPQPTGYGAPDPPAP
ncbi:MAG: metal ABC transporter permease [Chthoniobacterales bacterium]|nr:metal ABC transporter permease [Chthoniobacterales bacterium]